MKSPILRNLLIHGTLCYVLCFILNTTIHEGAHAVVAKILGLDPVLHHNYVSSTGSEQLPVNLTILTPAAGPIASLIQALIFLWLLRTTQRKSLLTLFYLWMSVLGFINIGGYLMLTPLVPYGDTGRVFAMLNSPMWLQWLIAIVALAGSIWVIRKFTNDFERQIPEALNDRPYAPGQLPNLMIAYPTYIGVVMTTLLSLPVPTFISILYPATSPFIVFMVYGQLRRKKQNLIGHAAYPEKISIILIAITTIFIVITRLLVKGVEL